MPVTAAGELGVEGGRSDGGGGHSWKPVATVRAGEQFSVSVSGFLDVHPAPEYRAERCPDRYGQFGVYCARSYRSNAGGLEYGYLKVLGRVRYADGTEDRFDFTGNPYWETIQGPLRTARADGTVELMRRGIRYLDTYTGKPGLEITGAHAYAVRTNRRAELRLRCTGDRGENRVTRGTEIVCTARKEPADAAGDLVVTQWSYEGKLRTDGDVASPRWAGPMVRRGTVEVRATIGGGSALHDRQSVRVERRGWSVMQFAVPRHVIDLDPESMKNYPPAGIAFGRFKPVWPDFAGLPAQRVPAGPNTGYWYLLNPVELPQPLAYVHPALYVSSPAAGLSPSSPGYPDWFAWHSDQNGTPWGTCDSTAVPLFRTKVEVHEGVTGATQSHFGVGNRVLRNTKLHERFDDVFSEFDEGDLRYRANVTWQRWIEGPYRSAQSQFDASDYPNVFNLGGCTLDNSLRNP